MTRARLLIGVLACFVAGSVCAHSDSGMAQDPVLHKVMIDHLEVREGSGSPVDWKLQAWIGGDRDKAWFRTRGAYVDGTTDRAELQLLYNRAVAPFWDARFGLRMDPRPSPRRDWLALGMHGLAPWHVEVDAMLFVGEDGRTGLRIEAEHELRLTQRLVLAPRVELAAHGRDDAETATGSGISGVEAGLRLGYEVMREFAPYVGVEWRRNHGSTADFARAAGRSVEDTRLLVGVRAWF